MRTADHPLLVRKRGDPGGALGAPCCRHTAGVVAQQIGRPISDSEFRSATSARQAQQALGWSADYFANEDLEAERLFDYGVLAPPVPAGGASPLRLTTCQDTRLAGAGEITWRGPDRSPSTVFSGVFILVLGCPLTFPSHSLRAHHRRLPSAPWHPDRPRRCNLGPRQALGLHPCRLQLGLDTRPACLPAALERLAGGLAAHAQLLQWHLLHRMHPGRHAAAHCPDRHV